MRMTDALSGEELARLFAATQATLDEWRDALIAETGDGFPERSPRSVRECASTAATASRARSAARAVQRIRYAANEANYCPTCQTGGRLLADRGLSRLLKGDWPRSLEELERRKRERR